MHAIEFEGSLENGMIRIPAELKHLNPKRLRIVALYEQEGEKDEGKSWVENRPFSALSLNTKGFKFNREQAHAR